MKSFKAIGIAILVIAIAVVLVFVLMSHGDELVSGVALADAPVTDIQTLDGIISSKGAEASGFHGTLFTTSCVEYGKYVQTSLTAIPQGKALYANVLFIASFQGMQYKAVWTKDGQTVREETKGITVTDKREAVNYTLDETLAQKGEYTLAIYYTDKQIYSQQFKVD